MPPLDAAVVLDRLCEAGVPAALRALLHERSALLHLTADNMKALPAVIDLTRRLVNHERTRRALLADTPDSLLLVMFAVARLHPHAELRKTAPASMGDASSAASVLYGALEGLALDDHDVCAMQAFESLVKRLNLADDVSKLEPALLAAAKLLTSRLGWLSGGASPSESPDELGLRTFFNLNAAVRCAGCSQPRGADGQALRKCGRCQATHYCSRECQVAHWKTHKSSCVAVRDKS